MLFISLQILAKNQTLINHHQIRKCVPYMDFPSLSVNHNSSNSALNSAEIPVPQN